MRVSKAIKPTNRPSASASRQAMPMTLSCACAPSPLVMSSSGTTARSCATRMAVAMQPAGEFFSSASAIIFIATAVEEMDSMKPITTPPSTSPWTYWVNSHSDDVTSAMVTTVTPSAIGSNLRKACSRNSMPMMNSSISTPRSAMVSIGKDGWISPAPLGPSATPTRIKPAAAGMRSRAITSPQITAAASSRARAAKASVCIRGGRDRIAGE